MEDNHVLNLEWTIQYQVKWINIVMINPPNPTYILKKFQNTRNEKIVKNLDTE